MSTESPSGQGSAPVRLGALETQVMDLLWSAEHLTVREIIERLPTEPAYTTIATVLSNLRKKHLVSSQKAGHATFYRASVRREDHAARIMGHALSESGDRAASMLQFLNSMSEADRQLLRSHLMADRSNTGETDTDGRSNALGGSA